MIPVYPQLKGDDSMKLVVVKNSNIENFESKVNEALTTIESLDREVTKITFHTEVSMGNCIIFIAFILHTQRKIYPNPCFLNTNMKIQITLKRR